MSENDGVKVSPIGAGEYILICKKVADKLRDVPGIGADATAQAFIATTDTVYKKMHAISDTFDTSIITETTDK